MSDTPTPPRRWLRPLAAILVVGTLVTLPVVAVAQARGGFDGPCHGGHDGDAQEHLDRMLEHGLSRLDATDEQKAQIEAAVAGLAPDLDRYRDEGAGLHEALREALTAGAIDPARVEAVRTDALDLADEASARMLGVVVKVAQVLTPEQREELADWGPPHGRGGRER